MSDQDGSIQKFGDLQAFTLARELQLGLRDDSYIEEAAQTIEWQRREIARLKGAATCQYAKVSDGRAKRCCKPRHATVTKLGTRDLYGMAVFDEVHLCRKHLAKYDRKAKSAGAISITAEPYVR